jgi:SAM-dependent methyltransferase
MPPLKGNVRRAIPIVLRKRIAVWLSRNRWFADREHLSAGIIGDMRAADPKTFHKFMWSNHISGYAKWYDSESLFEIRNMEPSRREFFNDFRDVITGIGLDPGKDIGSVLEVGCSLGYLLRFIETDILPATTELVGIDIDPIAIEKGTGYLGRVGSKVRLIEGDIEELDELVSDRIFDVAFAAGVLSYLDGDDAARVVSKMLHRTGKLLALIGLACPTTDNSRLTRSVISPEKSNQWFHNFKMMVEAAGGRVIKCRWEGAKQYNHQTMYSVFATPASGPRMPN